MNSYPSPAFASRPRRGFTLIELLTVIAIIGILAAIIIPVVGKVRTTAKRAQGLSNLRQVNLAGLAYVNENKSRWFHATSRPKASDTANNDYYYPKYLTRYINSEAVGNKPFGDYFYDPMVAIKANNVMHFAVLRVLFGETNNPGFNNFGKIKNPSTQVFFADNWVDPTTGNAGTTIQNTGFDAYGVNGALSEAGGSALLPDPYTQANQYLDLSRDPGMIKLGFMDGHVAIVKRAALFRRIFDPRYNM